MNRSESIGDLVTALSKAQAEFTPAKKDSDNPYFNSKYADLATVIDAVRPALSKHGIAIMQFNYSDLPRQVALVTTALHHAEQFISITAEAPASAIGKDGKEKFNVQTLGACWTYLRRYTLQAICGLASEDDDGNSLAEDPKKQQVYAEVERQKASVTTRVDPNAKIGYTTDVPPELDWSYNKASGVLICRIINATKAIKTDGKGTIVKLKINKPINGKSTITYFHSSFVELLLNAIGKVVKLSVIEKGDFVNVDDVLEVDGARVPHNDKPESAEVQARLLASQMDFTEDDLSELLTRFCSGNWAIALDKLKEEKVRRESEVVA